MGRPNRGLFGAAALLLALAAHAQDGRALHIYAPNPRAGNPPSVTVEGNQATGVKLDPASGRWLVPIASPGSGFVTSYVVALPDKDVVAVQIGVPARILAANQSVYLIPTSLTQVDEATVRRLWQDNAITSRPNDVKLQFRYLQDLVYLERGIKAQPGAATHRPNAMRMRAAFMLLQVVRNLSQGTWFLVDPSYQDAVDFAQEDLRRGLAAGKCKSWLGSAPCDKRGVENLLDTVGSLQGNRLTRMYAALTADGASPGSCPASQLTDLRDFYSYFHAVSEQGDGAKGLSETRLLGDIASCYAAHALCDAPDPDSAIRTLEEGKAFLEQRADRSMRVRLQELTNALNGLRAGQPAICPGRGRG